MTSKPRFPISHIDVTNKLNRELKKTYGLLRRRVTGATPSAIAGIGLGEMGTTGLNTGNQQNLPPPVNCNDAATKCYVDALIKGLIQSNGLSDPSNTIFEQILETVKVGTGLNEYFTFLDIYFSGIDPADSTNKTIFETVNVGRGLNDYKSFPAATETISESVVVTVT